MITGLDAGEQFIIPAAFSNNNFDISYGVGKLTILPAPLTIDIMDTSKLFGASLSLDSTRFSISSGALMYGDSILYIPISSDGNSADALPGNYTINAGLAIAAPGTNLSNYDITYNPGTLAVDKVALLVKANNATKIYGDKNPDFSASFTGLINGDSPADAGITGTPQFSTAAKTNSGVGDYEIIVSQGALASAHYTFTFENGTLQITPAPLYVKAEDEVIFRYDHLPKFKASIKTLKAGDKATVLFTVDPPSNNKPGVYNIVPRLKKFAQEKNYSISYTNGKLYVNPKCGNAEALKTRLRCVEKVSSGKYIAHFYAINDNTTAVYIPVGFSNFIYSFGRYDASSLPKIFEPGITNFKIPFDGSSLLWSLSSYEKCWYLPSIEIASGWSPICRNDDYTKINSTNNKNGFTSDKQMSAKAVSALKNRIAASDLEKVENRAQGVLRVYPNPVRDRATIYLSGEIINEKG